MPYLKTKNPIFKERDADRIMRSKKAPKIPTTYRHANGSVFEYRGAVYIPMGNVVVPHILLSDNKTILSITHKNLEDNFELIQATDSKKSLINRMGLKIKSILQSFNQ